MLTQKLAAFSRLTVCVVVLLIVFAGPIRSAQGIAFDSASNATSANGATSLSWIHTVGIGLSDTILVVGVDYYGGVASRVSSITYGSQSLTKLTRSNDGIRSVATEMWYLAGPAPGANNITIMMTVSVGAGNAIVADGVTFSGVDQVSPFDAFNSSITTGTHTSHSTSLTTTVADTWAIDTLTAGGTTGGPVTPQIQTSGTYKAGFGGSSYKGPVFSAGSTSMSWTLASSGAASSQIVAALKPAPVHSAPVISSFSASPSTVSFGQSTVLSWSVSGIPAPSLSISPLGAVTGMSVTIVPSTTTDYILTATNSSGSSTSNTITVTVIPDTTPPSVPANVAATAISSTQISVSWSASTDPGGTVAGYQVFRDGLQVATTTALSFTDSNLTPATSYSYALTAFDAVGNVSAQSAPISVATQATSVPLPIAFDSASSATSAKGASSLSWQHTVGTGLSNTILVVGVDYYGGTVARIGSITLDSQPLTKITRSNDGVRSVATEMWYALNPSAGPHTITVTMTASIGNGNALVAGGTSFSGVSQSSPIDAFMNSIVTGTHSVHATSLTIVTANAWLVDTVMAGGNTGAPASPQIQEWATYNGGFGGGSYKGPLPAGSASMSWNLASNGAASSQIVVALKPASSTSVDITPPVISIANPLSGSTISNTITLSANATDNVSVGSVQFQIDGSNLGPALTSAPYGLNFDTTAFSEGAHTITAVAKDSSNNTAGASVLVTINNTNRPNIVLILSDDQRWDTMQYMPLTTALLNAETIKFDNFFVTTPDCCPSRASILTGLYSHNTGVYESYGATHAGAAAFNASSTIATWLKNTGYHTGLFGKYLNAYYAISPALPPGWDEFHAFVKNNITQTDSDFYYNYQLNDNGTLTNYGSAPADYSTTVLGGKVSNFIAATPGNQPLFLYFTPYGPHDPEEPDPQDIGSYAGIPPFRPPSFNEADLSKKPSWIQGFPLLDATAIANADKFRQDQIETLQSVDRSVANIIGQLKQTGRWNNTILIFMSDNGLGWGEHRMVNAKFAVYEESVRVPMWIRVPGAVPRNESSIAANIDIAPTLASYAGVPVPMPINGLALARLINDPSAAWRSNLLLEYLGVSVGGGNRRFQAVRTSRYVYSELFTGERELYDLQNDPYELNNVYSDPAYTSIIPGLQAQLAVLKAQ